MRIDVYHLDAEFFRPHAPLGPLEPAVHTTGCFRITGPEHNHLGVLEAVLHQTKRLTDAQAHAVSPMMHGTPVPALPAVRVMHHFGKADRVEESIQRTKVVADIAPAVL